MGKMKKKISFIVNSLGVGGTEKHLLQISDFLNKDYEINLFCFEDGKLRKYFEKNNIKVFYPKFKKFNLFSFIFFLFKNNPDIYHFFLPKSYIIGAFLTLFSKKKKVMSRRSLNYYHKNFFNISLYLEVFLHKRMDIILTNSEFAKNQLIHEEKVPIEKVFVIKNFLRVKNNKKSIKKIFKIKKTDVIFAIIANLIPYKGHADLIKACSRIELRNWKLLVIGEDRNDFKKTLIEETINYSIENNVLFTGLLDDVPQYLHDIDFIINTSYEEGSSNALLESTAMGLPVVAYDINSNKEFVEHNKNGFLVKLGNIDKLTYFIEKLIKSRRRIKMGNHSKYIFNKKFNSNKSIKQYKSIYESLT